LAWQSRFFGLMSVGHQFPLPIKLVLWYYLCSSRQPQGLAGVDRSLVWVLDPPGIDGLALSRGTKDKNDGDIDFQGGRASVSSEVPAFTYLSPGSFSDPQGAEELSRYIARRGPEGWSSENISPPRVIIGTETTAPFVELLFTPSLSEGVETVAYVPLVEGEKAGYLNLYLADLASSPISYQTVSNVNPPGVGPYRGGANGPVAAGVSTDLSHVVFQDQHIYEWAAGKLSQVDISPAGTQFEHIDSVGAPGRQIQNGDTWHAVSANGLRVFFTAGESGNHPKEGQLYVRENPASPTEDCSVSGDSCTVEVSASQKTNGTVPEATQLAYFRDANVEGTRVFFTSRAELTNDANTGPDDNTANLYEYELSSEPGKPGKLADLTAPTEAEDPNGAAVLGLVTAGENAGEGNSYVYFVANGVLADNENANKETAKLGHCREEEEAPTGEPTCSLYVAHYSGAGWESPKFIATLAGRPTSGPTAQEDETDWADIEGGELNIDYGPGRHTARVTPDGQTLAFESERSLTDYDNERAEPGECEAEAAGKKLETGKCREVYLYDARTGRLVCASCDPSGARPVGPAELGGAENDPTSITGASPFYLPRNLSEDGGRLFFQSPDPLVPHDGNGKLDVYEWEQPASETEAAKAENSCRQVSGCILPISDVAGNYESHFMDASASGDDVFLATADQLVPSDTDTRVDVYDVKVGGGFPVSVAPPPCDNGDSCKPPVSPQPSIFAASGSATFSGLGNPVPAVAPPPPKKTTKKTVKCKKPKKLNHGKCTKKSRKKSKQAKSNQRAH
jgi:hypothetical protein